MQHYCGVDIGASTAKLVIVGEDGQPVARSLRRSGVDYPQTAERCLADAMSEAGLAREEIAGSLSTGYGRDNVPWVDGKMTDALEYDLIGELI